MLIPRRSRDPRRRPFPWGVLTPAAAIIVLAAPGLLLSACGVLGTRPTTVPPAAKLYEEGERLLLDDKPDAAREQFSRLVQRHPESDLVPVARFLVGETYYRSKDYERAVPEFETFVTVYPGHQIADLGQYRLARSYFDQMPTLERDQAITGRALGEFRKLIRLYPESRYAPDAIVKIEACRLRLAQKELWIADFYVRQGKIEAALPRYDAVLRDYGRTQAAPQALYQKADALIHLGRTDEAATLLKKLVDEFPASEWTRRARERRASAPGA
ncbi:MAG: outer membrane protein assembly factor BamD [Candidatus Rokuibacteriota bacterium]